MPKLKNVKHEKFCQLILQGKNQSEAYRLCGYKSKNERIHANQLITNSNVSKRIEELREKQSKKFNYEADYTSSVLKKLLEDAVIQKVNDDTGETTFKDNKMALEVLKELNKMGGNYLDNKLKLEHSGKVDSDQKREINIKFK